MKGTLSSPNPAMTGMQKYGPNLTISFNFNCMLIGKNMSKKIAIQRNNEKIPMLQKIIGENQHRGKINREMFQKIAYLIIRQN